jgi:hypothetical protein
VSWAGTEACPYDWLSEIRKAMKLFGGLNPLPSPVRADTAVRPYAEDLSLNRHSRFRTKSCRGRLPRLPARCDDRNAKRAGPEACHYEWLDYLAMENLTNPARKD